MKLKRDTKFWEESTPRFKIYQEFLKIWPKLLKALKMITLMGAYWAKYILFELKQNTAIILHDTEEGYKIWRGIDVSFQNWHKKFDKFWPEHSKISKIFILMDSSWAKYIYILFELKRYRGIISNETEEGYKIWRGIDVFFQNWHKKFDKFWPEHSKVSKILNLIGTFWGKYILCELKKVYYRGLILHELYFMKLKRDTKFGADSTCCFKIGISNITKFDPSAPKSQKFSF